MMKKLYISDLDGTLLNSQGKISQFTVETINHLINQGMIFTYATARSLVSATPVTTGLTKNLPLIIYNGTFIVNGATNEVLYKQVFNRNQVKTIETIMMDNNLIPMVYALYNNCQRVTVVNQDLHPGTQNYLNKRKDDYRINLVETKETLYCGDVFYFTVIGDYEDLQPAYQQLKDLSDYNVTFQQEIYRDEYWLEIMPRAASKANAIAELKNILGCDYVTSFGDAINDIPMFNVSDECYAMNNAVDELKAQATDVIMSNDEDGVARWLLSHYK